MTKAEKSKSERAPARILVVDDEQVVWEVIRNTLDQPGWYLHYAPDGERAIELLLQEHFDLVIADKNLPGITGLDVIRQAKVRDAAMATLMITAYASRESAEEAMAIGVDDYLVKPFGVSDLHEKVVEVLERRQRRREKPETSGRPALLRTVLVCEPDAACRKIIAESVRLLGHRSVVVNDMVEVLEALRLRRADALVCALETIRSDDASACFLRSTLLVHPGVFLVAVVGERGLDGAVEAAHHSARRVLYRSHLVDARRVAEELQPLLGGKLPR